MVTSPSRVSLRCGYTCPRRSSNIAPVGALSKVLPVCGSVARLELIHRLDNSGHRAPIGTAFDVQLGRMQLGLELVNADGAHGGKDGHGLPCVFHWTLLVSQGSPRQMGRHWVAWSALRAMNQVFFPTTDGAATPSSGHSGPDVDGGGGGLLLPRIAFHKFDRVRAHITFFVWIRVIRVRYEEEIVT